MGIFSQWAQIYHKAGLSIFPVEGKRAFLTDWSKYCQTRVRDDVLTAWIGLFEDCNIGVACGKASGVIGFDVDTDDKDLAVLLSSMLPATSFKKRGAKGHTYFYKYSGQTSRSIKCNGAQVIDVLSDGRQSVLPPSIHPDTSAPYVWLIDQNINDIKDVPDLPEELIKKIELKIQGLHFDEEFFEKNKGRNDALKAFVAALYGKHTLEEIVLKAIRHDKKLFGKKALFQDTSEFRSNDAKTNAFLFVTGIAQSIVKQKQQRAEPVTPGDDPIEETYQKYVDFFNTLLKDARKDIISGEFLSIESGLWNPVLNWLGAIKSYASGKELQPHSVQMHLDRYIKEKEKSLLIDVPEWDGFDRIKELGKFITLKGHDYSVFEDTFKEWLANIFRRLYDDGAQNRCIILKGDQGLGKDHLARNLLKAFGSYYSKFTNNRDERAIWDQVTSSLVLHIEEFDQTGSINVAFLKDIITRDQVTYRSAYGLKNSTRKCYASFISTVNIDAILRDETGNRRFAVFEIEKIDWAYPKDWSQQILAQAHHLYKENYKAAKEAWASVMLENAKFEQVDLVPELLFYWDKKVSEMFGPKDIKQDHSFTAVTDILAEMAKMSGWKMKTLLSILKTNSRSRHTKGGTRYFALDNNIQNTEALVIEISTKKEIRNYAPSSDRSP